MFEGLKNIYFFNTTIMKILPAMTTIGIHI